MTEKDSSSRRTERAGGNSQEFDWVGLVAHYIHPMKVAVIEALLWIGEPLSPVDLEKVFGRQFHLSLIAYHVRKLAKVGALESVSTRQRRGAVETFYVLTGDT